MNAYYRNYQDIKSQIEYAMERGKTDKVDIIPVLIDKFANWDRAIFGNFNPFPKNRKFVTDRYWSNQTEALCQIAEEFGEKIEEILADEN